LRPLRRVIGAEKTNRPDMGQTHVRPFAFPEGKMGFTVAYQEPRPRIKIIPPPHDGSIAVWLTPHDTGISSDRRHIFSHNLLSYSFSEAVDDLAGSFSFSVENEMLERRSLFDLVPLRSIVNIYEGDEETPSFRGIIRKRRIGATMTANGVRKSVIFSGKSIISCITEFMVPLDIRIPGVSNSTARTRELQSQLGQSDLTIKSFMEKTWEFFRMVSDDVSKSSKFTNGRLLELIDNEEHIGKDFIKVTGKETNLQYPVATMFYNQANNYITDVWHNILPKPAYELFACFDAEEDKPVNKPVIVARQTPFGDPDNGNDDWIKLKLYPIDTVALVGYDLEQSDEEVYTAFNSYVIGSPKAKEFYQVVTEKVDTNIKINEDKSAIYGFKLLSVSFTGFDRMKNETAKAEGEILGDALDKLNLKTKYWYDRLDEMYSGTITLIVNFNDRSKNPRAGHRVSFLGGQFYVEKSEHSWNYGKTPINRLTVSRGMIYGPDGSIKDEIPDIGKLYGEQNGK
jgi:hypothetical protein